MKVFVSYSHRQGKWVWDWLVPVLKAGGADVLIDRKRFEAGKSVKGQMDAAQDEAERHLLVLSPEYLDSEYCTHEMERAVQAGGALPVILKDVPVPAPLDTVLQVDLRDERAEDQWALLLDSLKASLGCNAPEWLKARDEIVRALKRNQSVNLVTEPGTAWRALIAHIREEYLPRLGRLDLENPVTYTTRRRLVEEMLAAVGAPTKIQPDQEDLAVLYETLKKRKKVSYLALTQFHLVPDRPYYDADLFHALRYLVMEEKKLVLLVQTREKAFIELLPDHPLSEIAMDFKELLS